MNPLLEKYASQESNSTIGLEELPNKWLKCSYDSIFRSVQDKISDSLYYQPTVSYAIENGITCYSIKPSDLCDTHFFEWQEEKMFMELEMSTEGMYL